MSLGVMDSCFSISSTTPRPPVWMHTCSKASLKSGMYAFIFRFSTCRPFRTLLRRLTWQTSNLCLDECLFSLAYCIQSLSQASWKSLDLLAIACM